MHFWCSLIPYVVKGLWKETANSAVNLRCSREPGYFFSGEGAGVPPAAAGFSGRKV
jgi:hypothetical protein